MADPARQRRHTHHDLGDGIHARAQWDGQPTPEDLQAVEAVARAAAQHMADEHRHEEQQGMRTGPRTYTAEQAAVIDNAVASRQPLDAPALPVEVCPCGATADGNVVHALDCPESILAPALRLH